MEEEGSWGTTTAAMAEAVKRASVVVPLVPGVVIAERFHIVGKIGAGGMGVVYRARDNRLSRDVAIKVHARNSGAERLEREATAMAQLAHPNVVTIFEVGTHEGAVFIAMELVEGQTARAWRAQAERSWREVVRLYLAAGDGLAALHRAGLVHRDFKPDNVLVGSDGRVRVADLGLARSAGTKVAVASGETSSDSTGMAGTPAYMSPEQRGAAPVDAQADQYAFAAALSEALRDLSPPRRIRLALARGCAENAAARWPTLQALLDRLAYDPRPRLVAAALAVVVVVAAAMSVNAARVAAPCRGGAARFSRAWSPAIAEKVSAALAATGVPEPILRWSATKAVLDAYQRRWIDMYTSACEATRVHRDQSEDLLDRRMICLESRLEETAALTALFTHADAQVAKKSEDAARAITPVDACGDIRALTAVLPLPTNPAVRSRVAEVRAEIDRTRPLYKVGRYAEAKQRYEEALAKARAIGHAPLVAEAAYELADVQESLGAYKESEANARDAAYAAEASHEDKIAAQAWVHLVLVVGGKQVRLAEGHELVRMAQAALARLGTPDHDLEAELLNAQGFIAEREKKWDESVAFQERALTVRRAQYGDNDMRITNAIFNLALLLLYQDQGNRENLERALRLFREGLAIEERLVGPDHPEVHRMLGGIAFAHTILGRFQEAEPYYERATTLIAKTLGPEHEEMAVMLGSHGNNRSLLGDQAGAIALKTRAVEILRAALGPDHVDVSSAESFLAEEFLMWKRFGDALSAGERARTIAAKPGPSLMRALAMIGAAQVGLGRLKQANANFLQALAVVDKDPDPFLLALIRIGLARTLPTSETKRALELARQARGQYASLPLGYRRELEVVEAWLAAHR